MDIHSRIRARREKLGLTLQELGASLGVSWQTVQQWERPDHEKGTAPNRARIKKVADRLKTTVEWLTAGISANIDPNDKYAFIPRFIEPNRAMSLEKLLDEIADLTDANDTYAYRKDFLARLGVEAGACRVVVTDPSEPALL